MGSCCNKSPIPPDQQKIINAIKQQQSTKVSTVISNPARIGNNGAAKSSRLPRGSIAVQCPNCGTVTIVDICPICSIKLK